MDPERLIYKALYFEHTHRVNGGLLMYLDANYSWKILDEMATDRYSW